MANGKRSVAETFSRLREQGKVRALYALTFASRFDLEATEPCFLILCPMRVWLGESGLWSNCTVFSPLFLEEQG